MNSPEGLALAQHLNLCQTHSEPLIEALSEIRDGRFDAARLGKLNKSDRRLLDQFAYRYTRLQDGMGAKAHSFYSSRTW